MSRQSGLTEPVGALRVETLLEGQTRFTVDGNLTVATAVLVRRAGKILIIDPGGWNQRRALIDVLARQEIALDQVDAVIATHLHWDHFVNFEIFPKAQLVIGAAEWQRICSGELDHATPSTTHHQLAHIARLHLAQEGELFDGIDILDTPGHTSGHIAVRLNAPKGPIVVSGDALSHGSCVQTGIPELINYSREAAAESVQRILAVAHTVIPGHGAPFAVAEVPRGSWGDLV